MTNSNFSFELGIKELKEMKDEKVGFGTPNNGFASFISFNSLIPNSNEKLLE
jgi:hypothetical protein